MQGFESIDIESRAVSLDALLVAAEASISNYRNSKSETDVKKARDVIVEARLAYEQIPSDFREYRYFSSSIETLEDAIISAEADNNVEIKGSTVMSFKPTYAENMARIWPYIYTSHEKDFSRKIKDLESEIGRYNTALRELGELSNEEKEWDKKYGNVEQNLLDGNLTQIRGNRGDKEENKRLQEKLQAVKEDQIKLEGISKGIKENLDELNKKKIPAARELKVTLAALTKNEANFKKVLIEVAFKGDELEGIYRKRYFDIPLPAKKERQLIKKHLKEVFPERVLHKKASKKIIDASSLEALINDVNSSLTSFESKKKSFESKDLFIKQMLQKVSDVVHVLTNTLARGTSFEEEMLRVQEQSNLQKEELQQAVEELSEKEKENKQLAGQLNILSNEKSNLSNVNATLQKDQEQLQTQLVAAQEGKKASDTALAEARQSLEQRDVELVAVQEGKKASDTALAEARQSLEQKDVELVTAQEGKKASDTALAEARQSLEQKDVELVTAQEGKKASDTALAEARQSLEQKDVELVTAQEGKKASDTALAEARQSLEQKDVELVTAQERKKASDTALAEARQSLEQKDVELVTVQEGKKASDTPLEANHTSPKKAILNALWRGMCTGAAAGAITSVGLLKVLSPLALIAVPFIYVSIPAIALFIAGGALLGALIYGSREAYKQHHSTSSAFYSNRKTLGNSAVAVSSPVQND